MIKQLGGTTGAVLTGACCLGFAPLLAGLSAIGAGFLIRDAILIPLYLLFLSFTLWSLWRSRSRHHRAGPFNLGLASAIIAFVTLWLFAPLAWAGIAGFIAAAIWDIVALRRASCAASTAGAD